MCFVLFLSMSLLIFCKRSANGPAAADEIQTKNKKYSRYPVKAFVSFTVGNIMAVDGV